MTRYESLIVYAQRIGADVKEIDFCTSKKYGKNIDNIFSNFFFYFNYFFIFI